MKGVDQNIIDHAIENAEIITSINSELPPIFSLRHLSHLTGVDYVFLRSIIERKDEEPYKVFRLNKRSKGKEKRGFRIICIPDAFLMQTQKWITNNILNCGQPHSASFAYAKNNKIIDAAKLHCESRWMVKLDVRNFFESFSEISAYRVFRSFGYQPLISFELSRLCTRLGKPTKMRTNSRWLSTNKHYTVIKKYKNIRMGHFPQGAPTSPMLSNLAMKDFDKCVEVIARKNGLVYSRYADDLCLSTTDDKNFNREIAKVVINNIYKEMGKIGLTPNVTKTQIIPPGARKIVLGLLVDGKKPKLSREFRSKLRMHFYYMKRSDIGPSLHAQNRGFESVLGLKNHIEGLIAYAGQIDPNYASLCTNQMSKINWPF